MTFYAALDEDEDSRFSPCSAFLDCEYEALPLQTATTC